MATLRLTPLAKHPPLSTRLAAMRALQVGSALTLASTVWIHLRIWRGEAIEVPWLEFLGYSPLLLGGAYAAWLVGTVVIGTPAHGRFGLLAPIGATVALAVDQQTSNTFGLLVVLFSALFWWSARLADRNEPSSSFPLRAIQAQISVVFFWTMFAKINPLFLSGSVMAVSWTGPLAGPLPLSMREFRLMALATVVFELALVGALWITPVRRLAVWSALAFHATTIAFLQPTLDLLAYVAIMATGYVLFLGEPWRLHPDGAPPARLQAGV